MGKCNHYMYRGEAVFFARFDGESSHQIKVFTQPSHLPTHSAIAKSYSSSQNRESCFKNCFKTVSAEGNWKFGLKDLAISSGKTGISTKYPLEGKDYFHASNCDTHNAYHQVTKFLCVFF